MSRLSDFRRLGVCWIRCLLHRPYLLMTLPEAGQPDRYAGSRTISVASSEQMIALVREAMADVPLNMRVNFFCQSNLCQQQWTVQFACRSRIVALKSFDLACT